MKNVLFALAFVLMGSFAFANTNVENSSHTIKFSQENKVKESETLFALHNIHVKLSCGVEYDITNYTGTAQQLANSVIAMDNFVCGGTPMLPV